jgi:hypothetical protein
MGNSINKGSARGSIGSWFAKVEGTDTPYDGQSLPILWSRFWRSGTQYEDDGVDHGGSKYENYFAALQSGKVALLARPKSFSDRDYQNMGYVGILQVDNLREEGGKLKLDIVEYKHRF